MAQEHAFIPLQDRTARSPSGHVFRGLPAARRSRVWIFLQVFASWTLTLFVSLAMFGVLFFYSESMPIMNKTTKRQFNAIITGLSIILGISVASGLNEVVAMMRWWFLSRRYRSLKKIEAILQVENLKQVAFLGCRTTRAKVQVCALLWVLLVLASQVAVAALGLSYGVEVAGHEALVVKPGLVAVPDMSRLQLISDTTGQENPSPAVLEYMANSYGTISTAYNTGTLDQKPLQGQLRDATDSLMFCGDTICHYVFYERAATSYESGDEDADDEKDEQKMRLIAATSRSINATAQCQSWPVLAASDADRDNVSLDTDGSQPLNVTFPLPSGTNQTVFQTNTTASCGTGCALITAMELAPSTSWFYNCTLLVGPVANATLPGHRIGASVRDLAARGIALTGLSPQEAADAADLQAQNYPSQSPIGTPVEGIADIMALRLARFAIGVVAVTAENNSPVTLPGFMPRQGVTLKVDHWGYVVLILLLVTGVHFVLGAAAAVVASRVVVPRGGPVAQAQILRPVTECLCSGRVEGDMVTRRWRYRCEWVQSEGMYDVYMEEEPRVERGDEAKWGPVEDVSPGAPGVPDPFVDVPSGSQTPTYR